uniref:Pre-mRNA-splicing factor RBM22 n=1 Tax=Strongyloides venezuelensis TaxID=75913 RepID=A0A0K0FI33_STRVS
MAYRAAGNYNIRSQSDTGEFPIICETCLGPNPYGRMMKSKNSSECKVCTRVFTSFRWLPGRGARYKSTEICQLCAKLKNVCQTCLLDLQYGLPVQVRDQILQVNDNMPKEGANKEFYLQQQERNLSLTDGTTPGGAYGQIIDDGKNTILTKLARTQPYYDRNKSHICSFFVKGECKRGDECPYRHEMPKDPDNPLSQQNIKDRYYGQNDPVASKLLNKANALPKLIPPEDITITTLYIGGLIDVDEDDLRDNFYQYGEITNVTVLPEKGCGFVTFGTRSAAEKAAAATFNNLTINDKRLSVKWGKPQTQKTNSTNTINLAPDLPPIF